MSVIGKHEISVRDAVIYERLKVGVPVIQIADEFDLSIQRVYQLKHRFARWQAVVDFERVESQRRNGGNSRRATTGREVRGILSI